MKAKKKDEKPTISISDVSITTEVKTEANEHTRAAVEALARAAEANANAIAEIAKALKGGGAEYNGNAISLNMGGGQ